MALNFDQYLNVPVENIEAAKPLPVGHFFATIQSWKGREVDYKDGNPKVPVIELTFKTSAPDEDVDETLLPANGGVGVLVTKDYRLVAPSGGKIEGGGQNQLRRLAEETCQLDTKGLNLSDVLEQLKGQEVRVYNEPRPDKNDDAVFYNNITKVLPAG